LDGNVHGMNFYGGEETRFLPRRIILECLKSFGLSRYVFDYYQIYFTKNVSLDL
ncbi:hypothetical protein BAE44_0008284, partial [Dichanthelium oligosanthes]